MRKHIEPTLSTAPCQIIVPHNHLDLRRTHGECGRVRVIRYPVFWRDVPKTLGGVPDSRVRVIGMRDTVVLVGGIIRLGGHVFGEGKIAEAGLAVVVLQKAFTSAVKKMLYKRIVNLQRSHSSHYSVSQQWHTQPALRPSCDQSPQAHNQGTSAETLPRVGRHSGAPLLPTTAISH